MDASDMMKSDDVVASKSEGESPEGARVVF
jgi:hypothetical protein